jgi:hypothetical protein
MPVIPSRDQLRSVLAATLPPTARAWLDEQLDPPGSLADRTKLRIAIARAVRKLGTASEQTVVLDAAPWALIDLARAALCLRALELAPTADHAALIAELYRTGELREQQSLLRALPMFPDPARFVTTAIESCRTNSPLVFAAIANDNPYPAAHFPALNFNQLVLKAIFLGVPVARIVGLPQRATAELRRMVSEYASERRAAGRPIPSDVDHVLAISSAS